MSAEGESQPGSSKMNQEENDADAAKRKEEDASRFECNICLDTARDAVVSMCGHLFCWPCLVQWLDTRPNRQVCPVCKAAISRDQVIPLYGRGGDTTDPRDKVPPRPRGQRTEAPQGGFPGFQWGDGGGNGGVHFSMGIGVFPISFMASWFSNGANGERRQDEAQPGSRQHQEEQFLSNAFMMLGIFFVLWLLIV